MDSQISCARQATSTAKQSLLSWAISCISILLTAQVQELQQSNGGGQAVQCDVTSYEDQEKLFRAHMTKYGSLDVAFLNAGILEQGLLLCADFQAVARRLQAKTFQGLLQATSWMARPATALTCLMWCSRRCSGVFSLQLITCKAEAEVSKPHC